ncbi:hypothetical protein M0811_09848 [Anaeramoeba ignava]|uniref:Uncharacterized protein n=1 Tax=Anaeramoeba ignava TaxID=1746090 RepID=A0A9Q0R9C9_ANAIG|nr:hypothetical protein M0811_09848 [Anaeramoeba ignava]
MFSKISNWGNNFKSAIQDVIKAPETPNTLSESDEEIEKQSKSDPEEKNQTENLIEVKNQFSNQILNLNNLKEMLLDVFDNLDLNENEEKIFDKFEIISEKNIILFTNTLIEVIQKKFTKWKELEKKFIQNRLFEPRKNQPKEMDVQDVIDIIQQLREESHLMINKLEVSENKIKNSEKFEKELELKNQENIELIKQNQDLQNQIKELKQQIKLSNIPNSDFKKDSENQTYFLEIEKYKQREENLTQKLNQSLNQINEKEQKQQELKQTISELEKFKSDAQKNYDEFTTKIENQSKELDEYSQLIKNLEFALDGVKNEKETQYEENFKQIKELQNKLSIVSSELDRKIQKLDLLTKQANELLMKNNEFQKHISYLETQNIQLKEFQNKIISQQDLIQQIIQNGIKFLFENEKDKTVLKEKLYEVQKILAILSIQKPEEIMNNLESEISQNSNEKNINSPEKLLLFPNTSSEKKISNWMKGFLKISNENSKDEKSIKALFDRKSKQSFSKNSVNLINV